MARNELSPEQKSVAPGDKPEERRENSLDKAEIDHLSGKLEEFLQVPVYRVKRRRSPYYYEH